jgi:hypothetical protein
MLDTLPNGTRVIDGPEHSAYFRIVGSGPAKLFATDHRGTAIGEPVDYDASRTELVARVESDPTRSLEMLCRHVLRSSPAVMSRAVLEPRLGFAKAVQSSLDKPDDLLSLVLRQPDAVARRGTARDARIIKLSGVFCDLRLKLYDNDGRPTEARITRLLGVPEVVVASPESIRALGYGLSKHAKWADARLRLAAHCAVEDLDRLGFTTQKVLRAIDQHPRLVYALTSATSETVGPFDGFSRIDVASPFAHAPEIATVTLTRRSDPLVTAWRVRHDLIELLAAADAPTDVGDLAARRSLACDALGDRFGAVPVLRASKLAPSSRGPRQLIEAGLATLALEPSGDRYLSLCQIDPVGRDIVYFGQFPGPLNEAIDQLGKPFTALVREELDARLASRRAEGRERAGRGGVARRFRA